MLLILEDYDLVFVEGPADDFEVGGVYVLEICISNFCAEVDRRASWRGDFVDSDFALDGHC